MQPACVAGGRQVQAGEGLGDEQVHGVGLYNSENRCQQGHGEGVGGIGTGVGDITPPSRLFTFNIIIIFINSIKSYNIIIQPACLHLDF